MAKSRTRVVLDTINEMDIAKELLTNRYLLNVILTNLYKMQRVMANNFSVIESDLRKEKKNEKKEKSHTLKERKVKKEKKRIEKESIIEFEKFSITSEQYEALVNEYGVDIVNEACVLLDGWFKEYNRDIKDNFKKLKQWAVHQVMKKRLRDVMADVVRITSHYDYKEIEDIAVARRYIANVPSHLRNLDYGVKYLVEKFKLGENENG